MDPSMAAETCIVTVVAVSIVTRCEPVPRVEHAVADSQLAVKDSIIHYTCLEGFTPADLSALSTVCDGSNWTPSLTHCEGTCLYLFIVVSNFCAGRNKGQYEICKENKLHSSWAVLSRGIVVEASC